MPACLLSLICAASVNAQTVTSVTGRITDRQGAGLPGATVTLYARERPTERLETVTDETGVYRFERIAPGEYLVEAKGTGFARSTAQQLRIESGATLVLDISLEIAGLREEVVVTASGTAQTVDEISKAITVIDQREFEERDEFSIPEALRTVPGLRISQLGGPGAPVSIRARGLRNQDTAILVDGLRLRDAAAEQADAGSLLSDLVVTDTNRVEVLRGSGSSLYGSNAIGGVINLVSNEGGGPLHGNLLLEGGSLQLVRGRVRVAGGVGEGDRVVYSAGLTHINVSRGVDGDDASRITSGQWRFSFHLTPQTTLSARLYAADAYALLNEAPDSLRLNLPPTGVIEAVPLAPAELRRFQAGKPWEQFNFGAATFIPDRNDPDEAEKTRFFTGALIFTRQPTETLSYIISYQALPTRRSHTDGPDGFLFPQYPEPRFSPRQDSDGLIQTLTGRADFRLGRANFITAGYEFEHEKYVQRDYDNFTGSRFATDSVFDVRQRSHALFVQNQLSLLDNRLRLSAAFRSQFFSLGHINFQPKEPPLAGPFKAPPSVFTGDASVAYFFKRTQTKLRAHVGNGQRAPSLHERFGAFYGFFCFLGGCIGFWDASFANPLVGPERSTSFDAGIDQSLFGNRLRATATYFYTSLHRTIEIDFYDPVTNPFPFDNQDPIGCLLCYHNKSGGLARGVELSATAAPTRSLDLFASYTYTNSDERSPHYYGIRSFIIPDHQFSLVASQRLGRHVLLNFDFVASSSYTIPFYDQFSLPRPFRFDGLVKADLAASYTQPLADTKSVRYFGKVENLFDREYFESGFRTPGRTLVVGMAFSF